jgi:hypothetical protein
MDNDLVKIQKPPSPSMGEGVGEGQGRKNFTFYEILINKVFVKIVDSPHVMHIS